MTDGTGGFPAPTPNGRTLVTTRNRTWEALGVADFSQPWIPASVKQTAASDANARAVTRFINGPGYSCGSPRPW